jgi:hypothetical protein
VQHLAGPPYGGCGQESWEPLVRLVDMHGRHRKVDDPLRFDLKTRLVERAAASAASMSGGLFPRVAVEERSLKARGSLVGDTGLEPA